MQKDPRILRPFGLVLAAFLGVVVGGLLPALGLFGFQVWIWLASLALTITALAAPPLLSPVHWAWLKLGGALGWINTRVLLGLVFFAVIWPLGAVRRLWGPSAITKGWAPEAPSYRVSPIAKRDHSHFERPY